MTYFPPAHYEKQFTCPHCGVYAAQHWIELSVRTSHGFHRSEIDRSRCERCGKYCYWYEQRMIIPADAPVPRPHPDLPDQCREEYEEARDVVARSPRAAAALMRLCIQKLLVVLGCTGSNINDDIAYLVRNGLPVDVQRAMDFCRVVGNNAVHPGELDVGDNPEIAHKLFGLVNFVVDDRISRPRMIAELYGSLPPGAVEAIEKRDRSARQGDSADTREPATE